LDKGALVLALVVGGLGLGHRCRHGQFGQALAFATQLKPCCPSQLAIKVYLIFRNFAGALASRLAAAVLA